MHFELLTKEDLLIAAIATKRPVAFLVGSPLSLKDGVGVPGVTEILEFVRDEIRNRAAFSLPRFETALNGKTGGEAYQEAMKWLGSRMNQDAINDVIEKAVLEARKDTAPALSSGNGEPKDWNIPPGTLGLAEMVAGGYERFLGPVLTTNFDPLISLAVRSVGGRTGRQVLAADGTLAGSSEDEICTIVHLHGFWRNFDTLHTQAQLTNSRPKLTKSLQRLLQGRTLIVAAYGGWDDVFTKALVDLMNDEQAPLDVIWCFYEDNVDKVMEQHEKLLKAVEPAIVMNRFRAFGDIDCHSIFGEILSTLQRMSPAAVVPSLVSPFAGWELIDAAYLCALSPLRPEEVIRYFDGATPTWRHAVCADIPCRAAVKEIGRRLADAKKSNIDCSLQLIRAAGGEGKSTLLLQAAADAAKSGGWNILWRPSPRIGLPPEHINKLDSEKHWLIVADDAENLVRDLREVAHLLHEAGCSHVHFLLAARDTDWRYFQGDQQAWGTLLKQQPYIFLRKLEADDANKLVCAWQKYGEEGLRELAFLSSTDKQVAALINAVHGAAADCDEGSFFGGLLAVRFGPEGLRNHVVALLTRLKGARIENSDSKLFDALLYVAACHAVGIPGLNEKVLADLVGVERDWVQTLVVKPLGEEAAAVRSAGYVLTRHIKVASAILVAAEHDLGVDIAEVWGTLVRQTVKTGRDIYFGDRSFPMTVHVGPQLQRELPHQFTEQRRKEIAIVAARAAMNEEPGRTDYITDVGRTYRIAGLYLDAVNVARDKLKIVSLNSDYQDKIRGYLYEWGISEGFAGNDFSHHVAGSWLQSLSLADHLKSAPMTFERAKLSCAGIGAAFAKLAKPQKDCPFARARRAAAYLGRLTNPDPKTLTYFNNYDRDADRIHTPHSKNLDEAISWLTTAVAQAGRELKDPFLKALLKPEQVSFNILREFLRPAQVSHPCLNQYIQPLVPKPPPVDVPKLGQLRSDLEEQIKFGIERVLIKAWEAVTDNTAAEDRFRIARQAASQVISGLSPKIRRQVCAHFETQKWNPLKARDPKM